MNNSLITRFFIVSALVAAFSCTKYNDLQERVDNLENASVASVEMQVKCITNTIGKLADADTELKGYIDCLKVKQAAIGDPDNSESISLGLRIVDLEAKLSSLRNTIDELKNYVTNVSVNASNWASVTIKTLNCYELAQTSLCSIRLCINDEKLTESISEAENSMLKWVGITLQSYYSISEVNAKLEFLQGTIEDGDETVSIEVEKLRNDFEASKEQIKTDYVSAIKKAINVSEGIISKQIADEIDIVNENALKQMDVVSKRINGIEERVKALEDELTALINSIQSIVVIPSYSDGSAGVSESSRIDFEVFPLSAAQKLAEQDVSILSFKAVYTETKSDDRLIDIPVLSHSYDNGIYSIVINCNTLSEGFF